MTRASTLNRNALLATVFAIVALSAATIAMSVKDSGALSLKNVASGQPMSMTRRESSRRDNSTSGVVIEQATAETFENRVLESPGPVLVDFYADWCGPCQLQDGILKEFAAEFDGGTIIKVNVDKNSELAARYDVQGLPTLLVFQDGQVIARQVGLATMKQLRAALAS